VSEYEEMKECEQEVLLWWDRRGFPHESYANLSTYDRTVLHNCVCVPTQTTSPLQRRLLYRKLCSLRGITGRDFVDPVDSKTDEEIRTFFSPLTPKQGMLLVDWGCE